MNGYGTSREVKSSKIVRIKTEKKEEEIEQFDAAYNWNKLHGKIKVVLELEDKMAVLLELNEADYDKLNITVRSPNDIKEIVQKQLNLTDEEIRQEA
jgi:hypothetical protein